ncbi:hypothetical protein [Winogradskyella immobilis]|uniref:Uncharacterized protein n=1 Tax=Winogradskyella immobilis TaxID=2816852 RepID=A0ABS8ELT1_9FLAO|nr:hypothetical protein [Winogradskyella immobilis]MCC1484173.1 hypothetical protein [Winogradskyella immobilis]MCG0016265.1 hypothetical protein [Winogradskyella immobilis]
MSSIEFIKHEYYKKWLIKRLLDKTPLIEFLSHNFLKHENFIVGELRGYTVVVGIDWQKHQDRYGYYYQVLFDPFINGRMLNLKECKSFQEEIIKNKLNFNLNSIDKFYGKRKVFLRKEHKDILSDIYDTIEWLMLRNFKPISFIEWIDSFSKASRHSETFYTK